MADQDLDVRYVANLARIDITEEEAQRFGEQLEGILTYVKQLESLDLDDIEPTAHAADVHSVMREDEAHDKSFTQEQSLSNAPRSAAGQFVMPKVIEEA